MANRAKVAGEKARPNSTLKRQGASDMTDDELAYVEAEREHFAQVARDTFQELKAVTAERDRYAVQLRDALLQLEAVPNCKPKTCPRCRASWAAPVDGCPECCCGEGEGCSEPDCTGTTAAGVGAPGPVDDTTTESRSSGRRDGHLE